VQGTAKVVDVSRPDPPRDYFRAAEMLGRKVQYVRMLRGLTQEELSELTGISRNQIQNIEYSRNNIRREGDQGPGPGNARLDTIFRLAEALNVKINYLVDPDRDVESVDAT
jgi:transcriptional regulator with XRE-family HTH domain